MGRCGSCLCGKDFWALQALRGMGQGWGWCLGHWQGGRDIGRLGNRGRLLGLEKMLEKLFWCRVGLLACSRRGQGVPHLCLVGRRVIVYPARHSNAPARFLEGYELGDGSKPLAC